MKESVPVSAVPFPQWAYRLAVYVRLFNYIGDKQKEKVFKAIEDVAPTVVYHDDLFPLLCGQTKGLNQSWKRVARDTGPWDDKTIDERMQHLKYTFALNDATYKKQYFKKSYPTMIDMLSPSKEEVDALSVRDYKKKEDGIYFSRDTVMREEASVFYAGVHEYGHHQMADFHRNASRAYASFAAAVAKTIEKMDDKTRAKHTMEMITSKEWKKKASRTHLSSASVCQRIIDLTKKDNTLLGGYEDSPEEQLLYAMFPYASLVFGGDYFERSRAERGHEWIAFASPQSAVYKQFFDYVDKREGDKRLTALRME